MKSISNTPVNASMTLFAAKASILAERVSVAVAAKYLESRNVPIDMAWLILRPFMSAAK